MILKFINCVFFIFLSFPSFSNTLSIEGNKKLSIQDIQQLSDVDIYSNDLDDNKLNKLVNDLYKSDLIDDLILKKYNDYYILKIIENKIINQIYINGNIYINDENILSILSTKNSTLFNKDNILDDIKLIKNLYLSRGFNQISVTTVTEKYSEDRLNLIFKISEEEKSYISRINIEGNTFFSENFLFSKLKSQKSNLFNIFNKSSNLSQELFNFDSNTIKNLYLDKGFFDVNVSYSLIKNDSNAYILNFYIKENERYKIDKIVYDEILISNYSNLLLSFNNAFENNVKKNNSFFDKKLILDHIVNLNKNLFENNISNIRISYTFSFNENSLDLLFNQFVADTQIINKINIYGNRITKDNVVRSKIDIQPGDLFIKEQVEEQINSLKKYKYINNAKYSFSKNDNSDLNIEIDENLKTGNFFFAATGSSDLGLGLGAGINDNNIFGSGNQINLDFTLNSENIIFDFNFIQYPYYSPTLRNNYSISNTESDYTSSFGFKTSEQKISAGISFDYSKNISMNGNISYKIIDGNSPKFSNDPTIIDNIGLYNYLTFKYLINYDSTNNLMYPSDGFYASLSLEHSPNGLSDNAYIKSSILNKNFYKISEGGSFLFNTNNFGIIESLDSNNIKTFNSFALGGSSFSGFDYRGLGPKNSNNIYLGGNKFFTSKIGIGTNFFTKQQDNLYLKLFLTTGSIWDSDYSVSNFKQRTSLGSSLDFLTPIGPVSISYGIPIQKSTNDILRRFDFRIGGSF